MARYIRAKSPSARCGAAANASVPCWVGMPATSTLSLTKVGTPAKNPPRGSRASARARSKAAYATAPRAASTCSVRAMAASTTSGTETCPGAERVHQPDGVEVGQGIVAGEGVHARHPARLVAQRLAR